MGSFSIWHWLIVLLVVVLIFGTKKLRNMGSDVGGAVKNFKEAMNESNQTEEAPLNTIKNESTTNLIDVAVVEVPAPKAAPKKRALAKPKADIKPAAEKAPATKAVAAKVAAAKTIAPRKAVAKKVTS